MILAPHDATLYAGYKPGEHQHNLMPGSNSAARAGTANSGVSAKMTFMRFLYIVSRRRFFSLCLIRVCLSADRYSTNTLPLR